MSEKLLAAKHVIVLTGAGISVESGLPPFRGKKGIWNKIDPRFFEINFFLSSYEKSWQLIAELFLKKIIRASPNYAHLALASLEKEGILKTVITQNIDGLHQKAGSVNLINFHGSADVFICLNCQQRFTLIEYTSWKIPPYCPTCSGKIKPDFVFFSEPIPDETIKKAFRQAMLADLVLIIGTSGEVAPANQIPYQAAQNKAFIAEINLDPSHYSERLSDLFIRESASVVLEAVCKEVICQL